MIDVNLRAPIFLTRIALPYLEDAGGGAIINVGSLAGRAPIPGSATYAASKAGMIGFTNRVSKNPAVRMGAGIYKLYNVATSSLGDILSYTRLLALGMATGGIAMVINVVALIAKDIPVIGIPAMILVLVGAILIVSAFGVFSLRPQSLR